MYKTIRSTGPEKMSREEILFSDYFFRQVFKRRIKKVRFESEVMIKMREECLKSTETNEDSNIYEKLNALLLENSMVPKMIILYNNLPRTERILICFLSGKWQHIKSEIERKY